MFFSFSLFLPAMQPMQSMGVACGGIQAVTRARPAVGICTDEGARNPNNIVRLLLMFQI